MSLELYRNKRNFQTTPEPRGRVRKKPGKQLAFLVQKHAASHLHYDFRLELNGVLLSWAVPKGPSLDPNEKRLAMHVEDHPMEYGDFEGVIPPKQYGSGTVMLWDRGTWIPKEDPETGYKMGKLKFELDGEKLRGGWTLVRSHGGKYNGGKAWLLIKEDDEHARRAEQVKIVEDMPNSVASGRSIEEIAGEADRVWHSNRSLADNVAAGAVSRARGARAANKARLEPGKLKGAVKAKLPEIIEPQLATLVKQTPAGEDWLHEMKYDGYRMLCRIENGEVRMMSRNGRDWTEKFASVARSAARLPVESAWLDGEVVVIEADGRSSFQALQNALSFGEGASFVYYLFDLPYLDGYDLRKAGLTGRKRLLETLLGGGEARVAKPGVLRYSTHIEGAGSDFFAEACRMRLEGIISKRADSPYHPGRGHDWVKVKCGMRQEMVIGGYTDPEGSRSGFGALLLGVYEPDGSLRYSGKVGTGFNAASLSSLHKKLKPLTVSTPPFRNPPTGAEARRSHWVRPQLVAEVQFTEWTDDGTLRHPSFQGLREDKQATEVVREQVAGADAEAAPPSAGKKRSARTATKAVAAKGNGRDIVAGVAISHPDKVLYPEANLTKRELALYYEAIGEWILPHVQDRPLTIVRCPDGWQKECFYQKNAKAGLHESISRIRVDLSDGPAQYMMANAVSAIVALLQMGALELHPWGSTAKKLAFADRIIFDLDPADELPWDDVVSAAQLVRTLLEEIGLKGFVKTTGGKGLHVVVPIEPTLRWEAVKGFSKTVAELLCRTFPDRFTPKITKSTRRGKIYIDYLRNAEGSTAIAAYSLRARANAPVATPITWDELKKDVRFDHFNVKTVQARLKRMKNDPWAGFFTLRQSITREMMKQIGFTLP
jgi:bifunctional non-homologous end joining protein LigD